MSHDVHQKSSGSVDARTVRTRRALTHAFVELMQRKPYADISVEEICSMASVGRSTFYLHYADKDDLKQRGFEAHLLGELSADLVVGDCPDRILAFSLPILRHIQQSSGLHRMLVGGAGETIGFASIETIVRGAVAKGLRDRLDLCAAERKWLIAFLTGAFMGMVRSWLDTGMSSDASSVDAAFRSAGHGVLVTAPTRQF